MRALNNLTQAKKPDQFDGNPERSKQEVQECVIFVRLELYNRCYVSNCLTLQVLD